MSELRRKDLIQPELSYEIIGCSFDVHNQLGGGHRETSYQRALAKAFEQCKLRYQQQVYYPVQYRSAVVGKNYFDFLVEEKVVVEIKKGDRYSKRHIDQVLTYLESAKLPLAILINFAADGVKFKRIVNFRYS